jgi:hypothetical protein
LLAFFIAASWSAAAEATIGNAIVAATKPRASLILFTCMFISIVITKGFKVVRLNSLF